MPPRLSRLSVRERREGCNDVTPHGRMQRPVACRPTVMDKSRGSVCARVAAAGLHGCSPPPQAAASSKKSRLFASSLRRSWQDARSLVKKEPPPRAPRRWLPGKRVGLGKPDFELSDDADSVHQGAASAGVLLRLASVRSSELSLAERIHRPSSSRRFGRWRGSLAVWGCMPMIVTPRNDVASATPAHAADALVDLMSSTSVPK